VHRRSASFICDENAPISYRYIPSPNSIFMKEAEAERAKGDGKPTSMPFKVLQAYNSTTQVSIKARQKENKKKQFSEVTMIPMQREVRHMKQSFSVNQ